MTKPDSKAAYMTKPDRRYLCIMTPPDSRAVYMRGPDLTVECDTVTQLCPVVLGGGGEERVGYLEDRKIYMSRVFAGPLSPGEESKDYSALRHCRNCNLTSEVTRRLQTPDKGIETLSVKFATREVLKKVKLAFCTGFSVAG